MAGLNKVMVIGNLGADRLMASSEERLLHTYPALSAVRLTTISRTNWRNYPLSAPTHDST
jgi:single-stranded DNA-binding protein